MVDESREPHDDRSRLQGPPTELTPENHSEGSNELSLDIIFDTLSSKRRRLVIEFLRSQEGPVELSQLTELIAAVENDKPTVELTSSERKRVYVSLYQTHLPKMEDVGILEFEQDRKDIHLLPLARQLFPYLDIEAGHEESRKSSQENELSNRRRRIERSAEVREMAEQLRTFADRLEDLS